MYNRIPACYRDADLPLGQPLYRWLASIGDVAGELETLFRRFQYIPPPDRPVEMEYVFEQGQEVQLYPGPNVYPGGSLFPGSQGTSLSNWVQLATSGSGSTSDLVDPSTADPAWLPWIAQMLNVDLDQSAPLPTQRAQLENASAGWNAGTVAAIIRAAANYLVSGEVTVTQFTPDQWHYTVSVHFAQIGGQSYGNIQAKYPTYGDLQAENATYGDIEPSTTELTNVLEQQVPAGMVMTFVVQTGPSYGDVEAAYTTYGALQAAFATYGTLQTWNG